MKQKVYETERESSAAEDLPYERKMYFKAVFPHWVHGLMHCSHSSINEKQAGE